MKDKLIIFDIDGTITDTTVVDDLCFKNTFKKIYNITLENIDWTKYVHCTDLGLTMGIIKENFNIELSINEKRKVEKHFIEQLLLASGENSKSFLEIPGSVKFINHLRNENYPVALATGAWKQSALFKLGKVKLDIKGLPFAHSDELFSRADITNDAIKQAEKIYGKTFKKVIYIGDGTWDYHTTKELGIPLIGVDKHNNGKLKKLGVKNIITDYIDKENVMKIIESL